MAKLINVYRSEEMADIDVKRRQLPVACGDLQMFMMDLGNKGLTFDSNKPPQKDHEAFENKFKILSREEVRLSLQVTRQEFTQVLSVSIPCVGCRRSVERLFFQLMESAYPTLYPILITSNGNLTISPDRIKLPTGVGTLLYKSDELLNALLEHQPRNKKSSRCGLHSLDSFRSRPFSEMWRDVWNCMTKRCKEEIAIIDTDELHSTLDNYLKKHKFCSECRTKVEKAYTLVVSEEGQKKEQGYVASLYSGIKRCIARKHIHVQIKNDYIDNLIKKAEPELNGSHFRHRERHAKTLEIAQEEVLTCIGMCIYEKLRRIHVCLKEEENACQVLAAVAVYALTRSFDMAVENKRGISNLELLYEELSRDEKVKEQKKEQKKLKKRRKRNERKRRNSCDDCGDQDSTEVANTNLCDCTDNEEDEDISSGNLLHDSTSLDPSIDCCNGTVNNDVNEYEEEEEEEEDDDEDDDDDDDEDEEKDKISISSCHSCSNNNAKEDDETGDCTRRSVDGGYSSSEPHHEGSCSRLSSAGNSAASSINSSPEGSEIACCDGFCNHENNSTFVRNRSSSRNTPDSVSSKCVMSSTGFTSVLQQMLDDSHSSEDEDNEGIPDEYIMEFKSRHVNVEKEREELRERLKQNFKRFCSKSLLTVRKHH